MAMVGDTVECDVIREFTDERGVIQRIGAVVNISRDMVRVLRDMGVINPRSEMLVSRDWLRRKIQADPDIESDVGVS